LKGEDKGEGGLKSFKVKLKVLSPIHIGSGETLSRLDYYFDREARYCRVDLDGLFADPGFADQRSKFLEAAPGGQRIDQLVPAELLQKHLKYRIRPSNSALDFGRSRAVEVKACIKSAGRVYIPGSSVKGSILSALCWAELRRGWDTKRPDVADTITDLLQRGQTAEREDLLAVVLRQVGGRDAKRAGKFTHWLDVSDSDLKAPAEVLGLSLVDVKNPNPTRATASKDLRFLGETIQQKTEFTLTMKLDPDSHLKADGLMSTVNDFYQAVAKADRLEASDNFSPPSDGLIRLGGGSGAYATSLLLVAKHTGLNWGRDGYRVKPPKSRKRVGQGNIAMGWAQMTLEHQ
jgi:CRISPR-associated protein Csm5